MHRAPISHLQQPLSPPLSLGSLQLSHRVVLAPVTRCRALNYVPQPAHVEFYSERAAQEGLLITEAVAISQAGIGFPHSPGIWSEEQVEAWRRVVAAVHKKGGIIFCQLWHVGRASHAYDQPEGCIPISSTSQRVPKECSIRLPNGVMEDYAQPRALDINEIPVIVEEFRQAAKNARRAGFCNNKGERGVKDTKENCLLFSEAYDGIVMLSGGFTRETGMEAIRSGAADLVSYGRLFISNADLPLRFAIEAKLNAYDRSTFYTHDQVVGYLEYSKLSSEEVSQGWSKKRAVMFHRKLDIRPTSPSTCGRILSSPLSHFASPLSHLSSPHTPVGADS